MFKKTFLNPQGETTTLNIPEEPIDWIEYRFYALAVAVFILLVGAFALGRFTGRDTIEQQLYEMNIQDVSDYNQKLQAGNSWKQAEKRIQERAEKRLQLLEPQIKTETGSGE